MPLGGTAGLRGRSPASTTRATRTKMVQTKLKRPIATKKSQSRFSKGKSRLGLKNRDWENRDCANRDWPRGVQNLEHHPREARRGSRGSRGLPPPPWAGGPHRARRGSRHSAAPRPHRAPEVGVDRAPVPWASATRRCFKLVNHLARWLGPLASGPIGVGSLCATHTQSSQRPRTDAHIRH